MKAKLGFAIVVLLIAGGIAAYISFPRVSSLFVQEKLGPDDVAYVDSEYHFSIAYPKSFIDNTHSIKVAERVNLSAPSSRTNYTGDIEQYKYNYFGSITIMAFPSYSGNPITKATCEVVEKNQSDTTEPTIQYVQGVAFFTYTANQQQDWYKVFQNNTCYWMYFTADKDSTLEEARKVFKPVVRSFRFIQ